MTKRETTYDVFLSYNNRDRAAVESVAQKLKNCGLEVFLDRWYLIAGIPWPQHIANILNTCRAAAIFVGPDGMGPWQQREQDLALNRQAQNPSFPVIPVLLPGSDPPLGFLALNTWIDMREGIENDRLIALFSAAIKAKSLADIPQTVAATISDICPYRGLQFFREEDAAFFFGRDTFVMRLEKAVNRQSLIAVVGASGSGKSSVVRAGLVPRLRTKDVGKVWEIATLIPGDRPVQSLAAVLISLLEQDSSEIDRLRETRKLAESLLRKEVRLRDVISRALEKQPGTDRLMLVVDQWEEIYASTVDHREQQRFLDELLDATSSEKLCVVLTLRGDFFDHVTSYRPFSDRLQEVVQISSLTREELREVIEKPANKLGLQFEPGLVGRLLDHVGGEPGSLFLLEFVLMELWKKRRNSFLTHVAYEELGELRGAIAVHAETVFAGLTFAQQKIAQRVLLKLVRPGVDPVSGNSNADTEPIRRRISFAELENDDLPVVRKLASAHLVVTGRSNVSGEEIVDLVHEALIQAWGRLREWIAADREFLSWREQLRALMAIWQSSARKSEMLLRDSFLDKAKEQVHQRKLDLSAPEQQYIEASIKARKMKIIWRTVSTVIATVLVIVAIEYWFRVSKQSPTPDLNANGSSSPPTNSSSLPGNNVSSKSNNATLNSSSRDAVPIHDSGGTATKILSQPDSSLPSVSDFIKPAEPQIKAIILHTSASNDTVAANILRNGLPSTPDMPKPRGPLAHWLVKSDGTIESIAPETQKVNHLGRIPGDLRNENTIAVESSGLPAFANESQLEALVRLVANIADRWQIPTTQILSHAEVDPRKGPEMLQQAPLVRTLVKEVRQRK